MADLPRIAAAMNVSAQTITTTTELAVVTTPPASCPSSGGNVVVEGHVELTTGTGVTAVTVRVRRGTGITGTAVGNAQAIAIAASTVGGFDVMVVDTLANADQAVYSITVQQAGATGNGTVNLASASVSVLS